MDLSLFKSLGSLKEVVPLSALSFSRSLLPLSVSAQGLSVQGAASAEKKPFFSVVRLIFSPAAQLPKHWCQHKQGSWSTQSRTIGRAVLLLSVAVNKVKLLVKLQPVCEAKSKSRLQIYFLKSLNLWLILSEQNWVKFAIRSFGVFNWKYFFHKPGCFAGKYTYTDFLCFS